MLEDSIGAANELSAVDKALAKINDLIAGIPILASCDSLTEIANLSASERETLIATVGEVSPDTNFHDHEGTQWGYAEAVRHIDGSNVRAHKILSKMKRTVIA